MGSARTVRIVEYYSHLNGREHILVHKPEIWTEIEEVVASIDAETCRTKVSKEARSMGTTFYSPVAMNQEFKNRLENRGWHESRTSYWVTDDAELIRRTLELPPSEQRKEILEAGKRAIGSYNQTDFAKNRVAVEVQFGKYSFVAYDLFVKHMAFFVGDKIDVGVELLAMKELTEHMSSGIGYYESELYNLLRQGRSTPAVPLVLIGVAP
jgi:hypothetical protein